MFPLFHINAKYTSVMAAMDSGARLVMDERFSASRFWDICRDKGVTAFNYQGALLLMLFKQPERPDDADNPVRIGSARRARSTCGCRSKSASGCGWSRSTA